MFTEALQGHRIAVYMHYIYKFPGSAEANNDDFGATASSGVSNGRFRRWLSLLLPDDDDNDDDADEGSEWSKTMYFLSPL